jgi:hypothetical protein
MQGHHETNIEKQCIAVIARALDAHRTTDYFVSQCGYHNDLVAQWIARNDESLNAFERIIR